MINSKDTATSISDINAQDTLTTLWQFQKYIKENAIQGETGEPGKDGTNGKDAPTISNIEVIE